ncbi:MAG: Pyrrolo-quinoline quinone [Verrucomicrobia bacterium]|nr:Pyrrolo-quinoline quinone [Verrucomicrobiota bacterium]
MTLAAGLAIGMLPVTGYSDWPAWRGSKANGSLSGGKHPVRHGQESIAWKLPLPGKGGSTPIIHQGVVYLTSPAEGSDAILAVGSDGKQKWATKLGVESQPKHRTLGSSCNSSPVTDGKTVFAYFRSGTLAAVDLKGAVIWKQNLTEQFGDEKLFWDQGSSPIVVGDQLVLARLHQGESWLAAFDIKTGKLRWKQSRSFQVPTENDNGYTTPILFDHEGAAAVLVWGADHLTAHDAKDGRVIWTAGDFNHQGTGYWPAISTPVLVRGMAVVPVGRDDRPNQSRVHAIRLGGAGDVSASHRVWKREDVGVFVPALAEFENRVFLLRHKGDVACLDPRSGETVWTGAFPKDRAPFYSSPVIADGVIYAVREDGVLFAARVRDKFEFLGETALGERVVASPALASDALYVRGDKHLFRIQ